MPATAPLRTAPAWRAAGQTPAYRVPAAVPVRAGAPLPWLVMLGIPLTSLLLQRFAVPLGGWKIALETPVGLGLAASGLLTGTLAFDRRRLVLLLGIVTIGLLATVVGSSVRITVAPPPGLGSLANWLAISSFAALTFRHAVPEERLFGVISLCAAGIAAAGIAQFVLQFAGLDLFRFAGVVPSRFLMEAGIFNTSNPIFYGSSIMRANGMFLVEPAVFSQVMAIAIIVEMLYFHRPARLLLYFAGLLISVSGTGWLVLIALVLQQLLGGSRRRLLTALWLAATAAVAVLAVALVLPEVAHVLLARSNEFGYRGTSGNERFVAPFLALGEVFADAPWAVLTGIGPGTSEHLALPYPYSMNSPTKILVEYGAVGLVLYLALLTSAARTARQRMLLLPVLVMLLFDGNWCQFPPVLFPALLIITVARLRETPAAQRQA